jgi:hypothetical protein
MSSGHNLDLGIAQINEKNLSWTGLTVDTAFDPCRNLAASAKVLFAKYNGSPPDAGKIAYAQRVIAKIPAIPADPAPVAPGLASPFTRPGRAARDLVFSSRGE